MSAYIAVLRWEEDMLEDRLVNLKMANENPDLIRAYERRLSEVSSKLQAEDEMK